MSPDKTQREYKEAEHEVEELEKVNGSKLLNVFLSFFSC